MGLDAGPDAGSWEVVPAKFYSTTGSANPIGEVKPVKSGTVFCTRKIRYVNTQGGESNGQGTERASGYNTIEVSKDTKTITLKRSMICSHKGVDWGILAINDKPYNKRLLVLTVQAILT